MKYLLGLLALISFVPSVYAEFDEGINYDVLATAQPTSEPDKIEVLELFWYGCPHCYHLEHDVQTWLKTKPDDVEFVRVPAVLGPSWELLGRAYYTAQLLGVEDTMHQALFNRIHKDRKMIRNVGDLKAIFVENGVSEKDFDSTFQSFAVVTKTNRAKQAHERYGVTGVPALIVNGKYRTSAKQAGGNKQMFDVVDYLVEKERRAGAEQAGAASVN